MDDKFSYVISPLEVKVHPEWGASISFSDYEHFDYIDDVLTEIFGVEYSFKTSDDSYQGCTIYFEDNASVGKIKEVIEQINRYHIQHGREFDLPSGT